ncbi:MAG: beta-ketoacyl synthase [Pirellulales bacterium]
MAQTSRQHDDASDPVVITGIGIIASVGLNREAVWQGVREGRSGVRFLQGLIGIPDGLLLGAPVDLQPALPRQLKVTALCQQVAAEALADAQIDTANMNHGRFDRDRFACAISGHIGDTGWLEREIGGYDTSAPGALEWWQQWMPNTTCSTIANQHGLYGPRICHSTACASGLIDFLSAVRAIRHGQADIALAGSGEAFHPLFAAGFHQMRVLAYHDVPELACRPFDMARSGFVMGEGAAMMVVERLSHAQRRGAKIYAEVLGGSMHAEAHHVTDLEADPEALVRLINDTLDSSRLGPNDIGYINVHGTGTQQNDVVEARAIRRAFGPAADRACASAVKSMLGHLVNASGSVELAITALALRDGFIPPTLNLTQQDPACELDCIPLVGRQREVEHALKISVAFGGHLAAVALRRWSGANSASLTRRTTAA